MTTRRWSSSVATKLLRGRFLEWIDDTGRYCGVVREVKLNRTGHLLERAHVVVQRPGGLKVLDKRASMSARCRGEQVRLPCDVAKRAVMEVRKGVRRPLGGVLNAARTRVLAGDEVGSVAWLPA